VSQQLATAGDVLTFSLNGERFRLPSGQIMEILRPRPVTRVPNAPPSLLGVSNLRGSVLPVISLARLLGLAAAPATPTTRVVVVDTGRPVGIVVDQVFGLAKPAQERDIDLESLLQQDFRTLMRPTVASSFEPAAATAAAITAAPEIALICFQSADQDYALHLAEVAEIVALGGSIAAVAGMDQTMLGVMPLRGQLLPLVSLRGLIGLPIHFDPATARVVVTEVAGAMVGLVVDAMQAIRRVAADSIDPVPPLLMRGVNDAKIASICRADGGTRLISVLSAAQLFDKTSLADFLPAADRGTAAMSVIQNQRTERFVIFELGQEQYGLPIAAVDEVVRHPGALTRLPRAPAFVEGVMSLRGDVIPVIDQRRRFALEAGASRPAGRIIVITFAGVRAGFAVDARL